MLIRDKIKYHRKLLGLTQSELGEKLGVLNNAVSKWERGRVEDIPSAKIKAMAALFGVNPSYLIDDDAAPTARSKDAEKVAVAFDRATERDKSLVLSILGDYITRK